MKSLKVNQLDVRPVIIFWKLLIKTIQSRSVLKLTDTGMTFCYKCIHERDKNVVSDGKWHSAPAGLLSFLCAFTIPSWDIWSVAPWHTPPSQMQRSLLLLVTSHKLNLHNEHFCWHVSDTKIWRNMKAAGAAVCFCCQSWIFWKYGTPFFSL